MEGARIGFRMPLKNAHNGRIASGRIGKASKSDVPLAGRFSMTESGSSESAGSTSKRPLAKLADFAAHTLGALLGPLLILGPLYILRPAPPAGVLSPAACPLNLPFTTGATFALYDVPPQPRWFLPLLSTTNEFTGWVVPERPARVCGTIFQSTWNNRYLWFHVQVDGPDPGNGWVRTSSPSLASFLRSYDLSSTKDEGCDAIESSRRGRQARAADCREPT